MSEEHPESSTETERRPPSGLANGVDPAADETETAESSAPPSWREDWRTALSGGDEKKTRALQRYASPENFAKAAFEARDKLSRGATAAEPPEDATEVELKEWRKQAGIPENPEGYGEHIKDLTFETEAQKAELADYLRYAHEKNLQPRAVKESIAWLKAHQAQLAEKAAEISEEATLDSLAQAKQIFPGREWKKMFGTPKEGGGLANDFLNSHFEGHEAQQALTELLQTKLSNGVPVGHSVHWLKAVAAMARAAASEDDLVAGDAGGGARSVDEEFSELAKKPQLTNAERERMTALAEARIKRQERAAAR